MALGFGIHDKSSLKSWQFRQRTKSTSDSEAGNSKSTNAKGRSAGDSVWLTVFLGCGLFILEFSEFVGEFELALEFDVIP